MPFDIKQIKSKAEKNYEKTWLETATILKIKGKNIEWKKQKGIEHPVSDLALKFRDVFLSYGFEEIINPSIVEESEVYREYGPEAPVILDRSFYLSGLPRPDIGIEKEKIEDIQVIAKINIEHLQQIFREYKEGKIEGDNLVEEIVSRLKIKTEQATAILDLFKELKELKPISTKLTLRSHMTAAWFGTIAAILSKKQLPFKLFSIGPKFRREQKLDAMHLYESLTASIAVVAEELSLEDGKVITEKILKELGFKKVEIRKKLATSKYYAPETEFEVFVKHPQTKEMIEIGDGGLYSPVALAEYNIPYPVFNVGFGLERIAMILSGEKDIRELLYPYVYKKVELTDKEIAKAIVFKEKPKTKEGIKIAKLITKAIKKNKDVIGPKRILVYKNKVKVFVSEPEEGKKMLGPAGSNEVYVLDGNIIGINPSDKKFVIIKKKGIKITSYIEAISNLFAAKAESKQYGKHTVRIADTLHSINIGLSPLAEHFITSNKKKIDVRGPIFIDVEIEKN